MLLAKGRGRGRGYLVWHLGGLNREPLVWGRATLRCASTCAVGVVVAPQQGSEEDRVGCEWLSLLKGAAFPGAGGGGGGGDCGLWCSIQHLN